MDAYGYCYNNPIVLIDPDGRKPGPPNLSGITNIDNVLKGYWWHKHGSNSIKDSRWVWDSFIPRKETYWKSGECADYSRAQVKEGFESPSAQGAKNRIDMFVDSRTEDKSRLNFQKGIDTIIDNLKEGKAVMAGVMYDPNKTTQQQDYANKSTNHYVTIVGMGNDENGNIYFSYYDNANGGKGKSAGTDTVNNRFTLQKDSKGNYYFADADNNIPLNGNKNVKIGDKNENGKTLPARYILTEIRDND